MLTCTARNARAGVMVNLGANRYHKHKQASLGENRCWTFQSASEDDARPKTVPREAMARAGRRTNASVVGKVEADKIRMNRNKMRLSVDQPR